MRPTVLLFASLLTATVASGQDLPAPIQELTDGNMAACREAGGTPRLTPDHARSADLNGDGRPDYLIDLAGLDCENAWSYFCGSAGCPVSVWVSEDDGWKEIWGGYAQSARIEGSVVEIHQHGEFCVPRTPGHVGCDLKLDLAAAAAAPPSAEVAAPRRTGRGVPVSPSAASAAGGVPPDAASSDLPEGWTIRHSDGAPVVAPGPGAVRSLAAFCMGQSPVLTLMLDRKHDAPAVLVQFAFDDWTFEETATLEGQGIGAYTMPLGRDGLAGRLAGRDSSVRLGLDRAHQGVLSLEGSTKALREALSPCLKL